MKHSREKREYEDETLCVCTRALWHMPKFFNFSCFYNLKRCRSRSERETRIYVSFGDTRQIGHVHATIDSFAQIVCSYMALLCRPRLNDSSYILRFIESLHLE